MLALGEARSALTGPVPSLSTPIGRDGRIDEAGVRNYIDRAIDGGSKTMMLTYGDSLYSALTDQEVGELTRLVVEHTAGRAMVIAADRQWATPKEVEFALYCREVGADMLMVLPPDWAGSTTVETLVGHYGGVAEIIPVMVVTNYFLFRSDDFGLAVLRALADRVPNVLAVKDDVCGAFARRMGLRFHDRFAMISGGQKQNHLNQLPYGCDGYLSTYMKFHPPIANGYWSAVESGDLAEAVRITRAYDLAFFDAVKDLPGGFDAGIHGALELFGVAKRWRPRPYYSLSDEEMERLAGFFGGVGLL